MNRVIALWILGFCISLGLGWYLTGEFLERLRNHIDEEAKKDEEFKDIPDIYVSAPLIGIIERTFFTVLVAFDVSGTAIAMIGWVTLKLTQNWHLLAKEPSIYGRSLAFITILGNIVSMFFALVGGLICRWGNSFLS